MALVAYLLFDRLQSIDFEEVKTVLLNLKGLTILSVLILVIMNYFILTSFDFMGFRTLGLKFMNYPKVLISAFICYVCTLNLGALVGGLGFRYHIYGGWSVPKKNIPFIILFSVLSNWSGYVLLLGLLFLFEPTRCARALGFPVGLSYFLGILLELTVLAYLFFCYRRTETTIKGFLFRFPTLRIAFLQLFLSSLQWISLSLVIFLLLKDGQAQVLFTDVGFTFLMGSIAGVVTHIPAGFGVLETVFFRVGPDHISGAKILAALIGFRAFYYLLPLLIAIPGYFGMEFYQKKK